MSTHAVRQGLSSQHARLAMTNWIGKRRESRRVAAKHAAWRAELDRVGVWMVQKRLDEAGAGAASVYGFPGRPIERDFVELWLRKKEQVAARQQATVLRWARIAGFTGILSVILVVLLTPEGRDAVQRVATSLSTRLHK